MGLNFWTTLVLQFVKVPKFWSVLIRSEPEAQEIYDAGLAFCKAHVALTVMHVRRYGLWARFAEAPAKIINFEILNFVKI